MITILLYRLSFVQLGAALLRKKNTTHRNLWHMAYMVYREKKISSRRPLKRLNFVT